MFFKYFFWEPAHPKEEEEEFSTTKRVRKPSRSTQKEGVRAAPLKGRRIDRHSTELNLISVNLTNLSQLSFFKFPIFQNMFKSLIWLNFQQKKEWPPHQKEAEESSTTFRWEKKEAHHCEALPSPPPWFFSILSPCEMLVEASSFWVGVLHSPFWVGLLSPSLHGWCRLPSTPLGGAASPLLFLRGAAWLPPSLGRGAFSPARFGLVLFSENQHHPKEGEEGSTTTRRRRPSGSTQKEGRESRTTEREDEGPPLN